MLILFQFIYKLVMWEQIFWITEHTHSACMLALDRKECRNVTSISMLMSLWGTNKKSHNEVALDRFFIDPIAILHLTQVCGKVKCYKARWIYHMSFDLLFICFAISMKNRIELYCLLDCLLLLKRCKSSRINGRIKNIKAQIVGQS